VISFEFCYYQIITLPGWLLITLLLNIVWVSNLIVTSLLLILSYQDLITDLSEIYAILMIGSTLSSNFNLYPTLLIQLENPKTQPAPAPKHTTRGLNKITSISAPYRLFNYTLTQKAISYKVGSNLF